MITKRIADTCRRFDSEFKGFMLEDLEEAIREDKHMVEYLQENIEFCSTRMNECIAEGEQETADMYLKYMVEFAEIKLDLLFSK